MLWLTPDNRCATRACVAIQSAVHVRESHDDSVQAMQCLPASRGCLPSHLGERVERHLGHVEPMKAGACMAPDVSIAPALDGKHSIHSIHSFFPRRRDRVDGTPVPFISKYVVSAVSPGRTGLQDDTAVSAPAKKFLGENAGVPTAATELMLFSSRARSFDVKH